MKKLLLALVVFAGAVSASAEKVNINLPMDAWYTVSLRGKKVGYFFSRYEWTDEKKTQIRYSSTMIRDAGGKFFEDQLQEVSTATMKPASLKNRSVGLSEVFATIEFSGGKAFVEKKEGGSVSKTSVDVPEDGIFGSFVNFLFLSIRSKMDAQKDYIVRVLDEGDYTLKECRMRLKKSDAYSLICGDQNGDYQINNSGLILSQVSSGGELVVKKTTMAVAMKGFPKPGERK